MLPRLFRRKHRHVSNWVVSADENVVELAAVYCTLTCARLWCDGCRGAADVARVTRFVELVKNSPRILTLYSTMSIEELPEEIPQGADVTILSKNEKKARELIKKLHLKPVPGITRVTFKQKGNLIYAIDQPDVFRSAAGTYVVFGEAKVDDMNKRIAEAQAQQEQQEALSKAAADAGAADKSPESITNDLQNASLADSGAAEEEDDGEVDETGLDPKNIDLIVDQTQVSRSKAAKALRAHKGDVVNAIMDCS